jgi:hypothetical protein
MTPDLANWKALFDQALAAAGGSKSIVAEQLNVSRTMVSLVANDKYHGNMNAFARRVFEAYGGFDCPHLGTRITYAACKGHALGGAPTSSARDARHWRACQSCPHKPTEITP